MGRRSNFAGDGEWRVRSGACIPPAHPTYLKFWVNQHKLVGGINIFFGLASIARARTTSRTECCIWLLAAWLLAAWVVATDASLGSSCGLLRFGCGPTRPGLTGMPAVLNQSRRSSCGRATRLTTQGELVKCIGWAQFPFSPYTTHDTADFSRAHRPSVKQPTSKTFER